MQRTTFAFAIVAAEAGTLGGALDELVSQVYDTDRGGRVRMPFSDVIEAVAAAKERLEIREYQDVYFRGHRDGTFRLLPSLYRQGALSFQQYWQLERRMFFEFRARARQLYSSEHSDWDVLFHMQHHGLPTRLLDWTTVFGVALYFAILHHDGDSDGEPCIWMLNPYALNKATWGVPRLFEPRYLARDEQSNRSYEYGELLLETHPPQWNGDRLWRTPLALYGHQRSDRMFAQSGCFTIHGLDHRPLEEIFENRPDIVQKIRVPQPAVQGAKDFLGLAGIDHRVMFPDLDGLARNVGVRFRVRR